MVFFFSCEVSLRMRSVSFIFSRFRCFSFWSCDFDLPFWAAAGNASRIRTTRINLTSLSALIFTWDVEREAKLPVSNLCLAVLESDSVVDDTRRRLIKYLNNAVVRKNFWTYVLKISVIDHQRVVGVRFFQVNLLELRARC